jgi:hypothetical protein
MPAPPSAAVLRTQVLGVYRRLLRTTQRCFVADEEALRKSAAEVRMRFQKQADVTDPAALQALVADAVDVSDFMLKNVVQLNYQPDTGRHRMALREENMDKVDTAAIDASLDLVSAEDAMRAQCPGGGGGDSKATTTTTTTKKSDGS